MEGLSCRLPRNHAQTFGRGFIERESRPAQDASCWGASHIYGILDAGRDACGRDPVPPSGSPKKGAAQLAQEKTPMRPAAKAGDAMGVVGKSGVAVVWRLRGGAYRDWSVPWFATLEGAVSMRKANKSAISCRDRLLSSPSGIEDVLFGRTSSMSSSVRTMGSP